MSHELLRLRVSLYNTPHLATPEQFAAVEEFLDSRNQGILLQKDEEESSGKSRVVDGIGVLSIRGPLTYRPVVTLCGEGGTNYQGLYEQAEQLIEAGAKTLLLDVSSGGGEAYAAFEYATLVRQLATDNDVRLVAYVEKLSASAAYAWSVIADEVIANPHAEIGSIGVVVSLLNNSEALKKEGYKRTFVTAGASKVPFDKEGEFREEFIADLQDKVDVLYSEFVDHVAQYRGLSVDEIKNTEAKTFLAKEALNLGLIDKVMTDKEFSEYLSTFKQKKEPKMFEKLFKDKPSAESDVADAEMSVETVTAAFEQKLAEVTAAHAEEIKTLMSSHQELIEAARAEAEIAKAELAEFQNHVKAMRDADRLTKLQALVGDEQGQALFAAFADASDEQFSALLKVQEARQVVEAKDDLARELGANGDGEAPKVNGAELMFENVKKHFSK